MKKARYFLFFSITLSFIVAGCNNTCKIQPTTILEEMSIDTFGNDRYYSLESEYYIIQKTYAATGVKTKYHHLYFNHDPFFAYKIIRNVNRDVIMIIDVYAKGIDSSRFEKLEVTYVQNEIVRAINVNVEFTSNYLGKIFNTDTVFIKQRNLCDYIEAWGFEGNYPPR